MKISFKIKKLETFTNTYVSAVKLTMFDDSIGWGQMSTYCSDITCDIFHRQIAPHAIGVSFGSFDELEELILFLKHKYSIKKRSIVMTDRESGGYLFFIYQPCDPRWIMEFYKR